MRRVLLPLLALFYGLILLGLALPRTEARLAALEGDPALDLLRAGQLPTEEGIERVLRSRAEAFDRLADPTYLKDRGIAFYNRARVTEAPLERARLLVDADAALVQGLRAAPADPFGWAYLALVRTELGDRPAALAALDLSFATGPFAPEVALMRSYVAMTSWAWLDDLQWVLAEDEFLVAAGRDPNALARLAIATDLVEEVREALSVEAELLERFETKLAAALSTS